jgi:hypothetical protein
VPGRGRVGEGLAVGVWGSLFGTTDRWANLAPLYGDVYFWINTAIGLVERCKRGETLQEVIKGLAVGSTWPIQLGSRLFFCSFLVDLGYSFALNDT